MIKIKRNIPVVNPPPSPYGLGPASPAVQERALRLYLLQPLARIAGEGDDPRISVRGEAGEGVPAPGARFARSTRPSPERRTFAR